MADQNPANETSTDFSRFRLSQNFEKCQRELEEADNGAGSQILVNPVGAGPSRERWIPCS